MKQLLLVLFVLGAGCGHAQVPNVTYSGPIVISQGGTYTGNYRSTDSTVPAVLISTTQPVILQNCTLVGPGDLIYAPVQNTDLTVRECRGYGTTPTIDNTVRGVFLYMHKAQNLVMEHNYLESNQGVVLDRWTGNGSSNQTVKIRYNRAVNLDGSYRNNPQKGTACFTLLNTINNVPNIEIAWNQIVNEANKSTVSDNLNFYDSGGTSGSWARVHDNYVQGAYPYPATSSDFNGTGMTTDGEGTTAATSTGYVEIDNNQFVSTCNGGINIASGHDVNVHNNRVVTSGYLPNGDRLNKLWCGINPSNFYGSPAAAFGANIRIADNTVGYTCWGPTLPFTNRYDIDPTYASSVTGNVHLPNPITVQTEQNEWTLWQQKLQQNNITPGLTGSTPVVTPPVTTTPTGTTTPTAATFYRAFNLNGSTATIDGNNWEAGTAGNVQVSGGAPFANQNAALAPATDAARAAMIRSSVYGTHVGLTVSNVPNASYQVYLYVWEDNNAEVFNVSVNGQLKQSNYNSGAAGHWDRLGPYAATVTNGTLTLNTDGGTANCSGIELWRDNTASTPSTSTPTATSFYRGIDVNGTAASIDGNSWEGRTAANYSVNGSSFSDQNQTLNPATDAARTTMLRSCQYSNSLDFRMTAVPNGTYQVYAYVWEDNYPETFSIAVNGQTVQSSISTGAAGFWTKLGPYQTTVTNGTIQLSTSGGTVNLSGVEVKRVASASAASASTAARATTTAAAAPVSLYPNPLEAGQTQVQVEATLPQAEKVQVQVLTHMGKVVLQTTLSFSAGTSSQPLNLGTLAEGNYVVRFTSGTLAGTTINLIKKD